jgi:acetyl-CoA carboxylase carboxyltransferase component
MAAPLAPPAKTPRLRALTDQVQRLERAIRGAARNRELPAILDPDGPWFEIGLLRAHDRYQGSLPAAGIITGIGTIARQPVVIAASLDGGAEARWWPETFEKVIRAQEVAFRQALPIVYLLRGGALAPGVEDGYYPGGYGPSRVLALAAAIKRASRSPQLAVRAGPLGGAASILADLADVTIEGDDRAGLRDRLAILKTVPRRDPAVRAPRPPAATTAGLDQLLGGDHRKSYDMGKVLECLLDAGELEEFQPGRAAEMLCGHGWIEGIPVAVIANRRGVMATRDRSTRLGGIIYTASAAKVAYFIETASRQRLPILFVQDVSGFMLGVEAEHSGIIRTGAELVEAMATAKSPRIALTVNHASGAGYYAMASQGFEPDFTLSWPTGRIGAMEAEAAINAAHGTVLSKGGGTEASAPEQVRASIAAMRASFERELEAVHAAARGHVDAIVRPEQTRDTLAFLLRVTAGRCRFTSHHSTREG